MARSTRLRPAARTALSLLLATLLAAARGSSASVKVEYGLASGSTSIHAGAGSGQFVGEGYAADSLIWGLPFYLTVTDPVTMSGGNSSGTWSLSAAHGFTGGGRYSLGLGAPGTISWLYSARGQFVVSGTPASYQSAYQAYSGTGAMGVTSQVHTQLPGSSGTIVWTRAGNALTPIVSSGSLPPAHYEWNVHAMIVVGLPGDGGLVASQFTLLDNHSVQIAKRPRSGVVPAATGFAASAAAMSLDVLATGDAPLNYRWRRNGVPLANGGLVSGADTPELSVAGFDAGWNGLYDCVVVNAVDTVITDPAVVEYGAVSSVPLVLVQPETVPPDSSGLTDFYVEAVSSGPIAYQWSLNGQPLADGELPSGATVQGSQSDDLELVGPTASEQGIYTCNLTNAFGATVSADAHLLPPGTTGVAPGQGAGAPGLTCAPNPAGRDATLRFSLARGGEVRLEVFDAAGRRVAALVNSAQPPGVHEARWDLRDDGGRHVAPGVYIARLLAGGESRVTRLAVVR